VQYGTLTWVRPGNIFHASSVSRYRLSCMNIHDVTDPRGTLSSCCISTACGLSRQRPAASRVIRLPHSGPGKFVNIHTVSFVDNVRVPLNDPK